MTRSAAQVIPMFAHCIRCAICRTTFRGVTADETVNAYQAHPCCTKVAS